jgi:DNA-binding response OmpR family regulator
MIDPRDEIHAMGPEDKVCERGVRDDSPAQLVRRLREKIESDTSHPEKIQTVAGRGKRSLP